MLVERNDIVDDKQKRYLKEKLDEFRRNLPKRPDKAIVNIMENNYCPLPPFDLHFKMNLLNDILAKLEEMMEDEYVLELFKAYEYSESDVVNSCICLSQHNGGKWNAIIQALKLIQNNRRKEFNIFFDKLNQYANVTHSGIILYEPQSIECALRYLGEIFSKTPENLADIRLEDPRLDNLLSYTAQAGLSVDQMQELNKEHGEAIIEAMMKPFVLKRKRKTKIYLHFSK